MIIHSELINQRRAALVTIILIVMGVFVSSLSAQTIEAGQKLKLEVNLFRENFLSEFPVIEKTEGLSKAAFCGGFDANRIQFFLEQKKAELLRRIEGSELAGVREYVKVFYPSKVEVKQCTQFKPVPYVSTSEAEKVRTIVLSLTANLAAASDRLAVDLHVTSDPHTARFEIVAGESEPRHTTTDSDITNLYRGYYHYKIEKANYKTVKGPLNLIDEEGNSIHCILHEVNNAEGPYPCIIKNK